MTDLLYFILCAVLTLGVLAGIAMMSRVKTAAAGNALSAVCVFAAIVITLIKYQLYADWLLYTAMALGLVVGLIGAMKVKMIEMPQAVALLNGFGGAASAIVAFVSMLDGYSMGGFGLVTAGLALSIGLITLTGSLVAGAKLHKLMSQKPVIWKNHKAIAGISPAIALILICFMPFFEFGSSALVILAITCAVFSSLFGIAFAVRVGGADMPVTISLLNSLSGVAGAIAGMAINDPLLVAIGGVVGASGLLLTQIMCKAMNRSLGDILLGKTSVHSATESAQPAAGTAQSINTEEAAADADPKSVFAQAKHVIIVPGYGMAIAQAQSRVKFFADKLAAKGVKVSYGIHPVAGRMPGHMNVLLAEVDVPYEDLLEMDEINPLFESCDAAVVVGANDVLNPAANSAEGTPIYGMPILNVENAKFTIFCNYDKSPGYAGVDNPLYNKSSGILFLEGDAKNSLDKLISFLD